jgi:hypothetical protein
MYINSTIEMVSENFICKFYNGENQTLGMPQHPQAIANILSDAPDTTQK